jgi:tight adherence protein B
MHAVALPPLMLADSSGVLLVLVCIMAGIGVFTFTFVGYLMFSAGWESYEEKYIEGAERSLDDLFLTIPPQQMLWLSILGSFAFFTIFFVLAGSMVSGAIFALPGFFLPRLALSIMKKKRLAKFNEQLVEGLITLTNALRSGFALPKAFLLIATDMPKPICQEFGILVQELRLGIEVEEGLLNMLDRVPSIDLDLMTTSIGISNSVGGNLAEVFDKIAETIRERNRIEGRIESLTAQGRMQGIMVSVLPIFVAVMINFIDPELMKPLYTTTIGLVIVAVMVLMECMGYFFVRKITNIEV